MRKQADIVRIAITLSEGGKMDKKKRGPIIHNSQTITKRYRCAQCAPTTLLEILQGEMMKYKKSKFLTG